MKINFSEKKKRFTKVAIALSCCFIILGITTSFGMQHYYKIDFSTGLVTADKLNVRSGPNVIKLRKTKNIYRIK